MGTTYQIAGDDVRQHMLAVMELYHPRLVEAGVTIDLLKAFTGDAEVDEPVSLKHGGYPCLALVRICSLKDRVKGCSDAEIVIDGYRCDEWSDDQLRAILDHELTHLDLVYDNKTGALSHDDIGRPKLKMRLHDRQFGWFDSVANRWGNDAAEVKQAKELIGDWQWVQMYLPGLQPSDIGADRPLLQDA